MPTLPEIPNDSRWVMLATLGWCFVIQGLGIWRSLRKQPHRAASACWSVGVGMMGLGMLLGGQRQHIPDVVGWLLASLCLQAGPWLWVAALHLLLGHRIAWRGAALVAGAYAVAYQWLHVLGHVGAHMLLHQLLQTPAYAMVALLAWRLARRLDSASARDLATVGMVVVAGKAAVVAHFAWTEVHILYTPSMQPLTLVAGVMAMATLIGSLSFLGVVLDESHRLQRQAVAAQQREIGLRIGAECLAAQLHAQLQQRDAQEAHRQGLLQAWIDEMKPGLGRVIGLLGQLRQTLGSRQGASDLDALLSQAEAESNGLRHRVDELRVDSPRGAGNDPGAREGATRSQPLLPPGRPWTHQE